MFRKPIFWIIFSLIFISGIIFAFIYFSDAFPIVSLDLRMDRSQALQSARELTQKQDWGPEDYRQAASFNLDDEVQNFVELEAGGNEAFSKMLGQGLYSPFTWNVRHFKEGVTNETKISFSPDGQAYGFVETLPEDESGPALTSDRARVVAETATVNIWQVDLTGYELVEESQEIQPGERVDHTFVYERPDVQIGEGRYRLRLVVAGDRLTELTHFIKIPEAFSRRYEEMRSANITISNLASIGFIGLYILGGCVIGLFLLLRQRWVLWRKPLFWGLFIAFLQVLSSINDWPLAWMNYDTALSARGFVLQQIVQFLGIFTAEAILLTVSFMAAESLTRKAFPHQIQFWQIWSADTASSKPVLGQTIGGYLIIGFDFAFVVAIYFFTTKVLGWWTPSGALFEPNILATYFPWLSPIAISLHAGFWEECMFRAVPIAGAALIGQRFGHRRAWIIAAFIVQALIFGGGHAGYPMQPAYARVVELIIPSLVFGGIYLCFGLLPAIIAHFAFDVIWFAMPLFVASTPGILTDRLLVIILTLVPLLVVFYARLRSGRWGEVREENYNRAWQPPIKEESEPVVSEVSQLTAIGIKTRRFILAGGVLGLILWIFTTNFQQNAPAISIGRNEAVAAARKTLDERGIKLPDSWQTLSTVQARPGQNDRFIWQEGDEQTYNNLLGKYLSPPHWKIRFVRFEGDVAERAEEYQVLIDGAGQVIRVNHQLPEARPGASLSADEARLIAFSVLNTEYGLNPSSLKEISAEPATLPARQDWKFVYADTVNYLLPEGQARITVGIAGDEANDSYRTIHIPEEWQRQERNRKNLTNSVQFLCFGIIVILILIAVGAAIVNWSRGKFSVSVFLIFFTIFFGLKVISLVNGWPDRAAGLSTAEPFWNQAFSFIAFRLLWALVLSTGVALLLGFVQKWKRAQSTITSTAAIGTGFSLGLLLCGIFSLLAFFGPKLAPFWADYDAAANFIPILEAGFDPIEMYIMLTTLIWFIFTAVDNFSSCGRQRRGIIVAGLLLFGLILNGIQIDNLTSWLAGGLVTGFILLLTYQFVFRYHLALIPLVIATASIFAVLRQGIFNAYPGAISGSVLAIILCVVLSFFWFKRSDSGPV